MDIDFEIWFLNMDMYMQVNIHFDTEYVIFRGF